MPRKDVRRSEVFSKFDEREAILQMRYASQSIASTKPLPRWRRRMDAHLFEQRHVIVHLPNPGDLSVLIHIAK